MKSIRQIAERQAQLYASNPDIKATWAQIIERQTEVRKTRLPAPPS